MTIIATNVLDAKQLADAKKLIVHCQKEDKTYRDPYLSSQFNFDPEMPAFFLAYEGENLQGLLTVYADDGEAELAILVEPTSRLRGIAKSLFAKFQEETASYPIETVCFQTERIFLEKHPELPTHWNLVENEETETWLGRDRQIYSFEALSDVQVSLAGQEQISGIATLQHQAFHDDGEDLEVSLRYAEEAVKDENSLLYVLTKENQVVASCTVDLSSEVNYLYGLAVLEEVRGQGLGSYLVKILINDLLDRNDKAFQIAVDDDNVGARRLYEKLGFVKQTEVVYLDFK